MSTVFDFNLLSIKGKEMPLSQYKAQVLLIVNVASQCGLTPQFEGLQNLYTKYSSRGFKVLGLPCNQFAA
ncbi:MAG: glutathione peroxidase, partial [Nitrospinota bacterium]